MTITYHNDVEQGSDEWLAMRCGILTASEMKNIITPTLKIADNEDTRSHVYELLSQRITKYVEPSYISDDMLRGQEEEIQACIAYSERYAPVIDTGFVTNDAYGFMIGYSPDGLVGDDGLIEVKSRKQKYQLETILTRGMPKSSKLNCMIQIQTGLMVTGRSWCDFISYSGGMPMVTYRIKPDAEIQGAILAAATAFEAKIAEKFAEYNAILVDKTMALIPTERVIQEEIAC